ncbi:MAG: leucyl/phenylalanyl-tRNA--protein transferase [Planctomycetes bacterium]|nr:leucyl/phenylalanyl-tRNA--protein transferase [Planctomycetota bacterium]
MPVYRLSREVAFPDPNGANEDGVVAVGGDLNPDRVLEAYRCGIFPWPHRGLPLLWFSPDPRMVLEAENLRVSRSLRQTLKKNRYEIRLDSAFADVMRGCAKTPRKAQHGTWITPQMIECYTELHNRGFAHSAEAWHDGRLVGGLYGVSLGGMFCGESMFAAQPDASKAAFATLVGQLKDWGIDLIDAQTYSDHLARFGAVEWPRSRYLAALAVALGKPTRKGPWKLERA